MNYWDKNTNTLKLENDLLTPDCMFEKEVHKCKMIPIVKENPSNVVTVAQMLL